MKHILIALLNLALMTLTNSCIHEHFCEPEPIKEIEDGFISAIETDFISQLEPTTKTEIRIRNNINNTDFYEEGYIKFNNITTIDEQIKTAKLKLYIKENPKEYVFFPNTYTLQVSALQEGWNENTLSYSNKPTGEQKSSSIFPADLLETGDLYEIDVTDILNEQYNGKLPHYGFGISLVARNSTESVAISFHSSDSGNPELWPELEIVYGEPEASGFPFIYIASADADAWGGAWGDFETLTAIYAASYNEDTEIAKIDLLYNELINAYSPASIAANLNTGIYWVYSIFENDKYKHVFVEGDNSASQPKELFTFESNDVQLIQDLIYHNGDLYFSATVLPGEIHIMKAAVVDNNTVEKLYTLDTDVDGSLSFKINTSLKIANDKLYWLEINQEAERMRIKEGSLDGSIQAKTLFDETSVNDPVNPIALAIDRKNEKLYLVSNVEQGNDRFYSGNLDGSGDLNNLAINSTYIENVTDLEMDDAGFLYWINHTETAENGAILRINPIEPIPEMVYENVVRGHSFEIAVDEW